MVDGSKSSIPLQNECCMNGSRTLGDVHALVTALLRDFQGHERSLGRDITPFVKLVSFSASKMIRITDNVAWAVS